MTEYGKTGDWHGTIGRLGAWWLNSRIRWLTDVMIMGDGRAAILSEIAKNVRGDETALDLGCGSGYFSLPIASMLANGKVVCLDLSEEMLLALERNATRSGLRDRITVTKGDALATGLDDDSVDVVVNSNFMHELADPQAVVEEMVRVLKPGGVLLISDFRDSLPGKVMLNHHKDVHGPFSVEGISALFREVGLSDVSALKKKMMLVALGTKQSAQQSDVIDAPGSSVGRR